MMGSRAAFRVGSMFGKMTQSFAPAGTTTASAYVRACKRVKFLQASGGRRNSWSNKEFWTIGGSAPNVKMHANARFLDLRDGADSKALEIPPPLRVFVKFSAGVVDIADTTGRFGHARAVFSGEGTRSSGETGRSSMGAGTMALAGLLSLTAGALPPEIMPMKDRAIQIPIVLNRPQQVRELMLFVSSDQGKTWKQEAWATPDKQFFPFYAKEDGIYWFQVCIIDQNGRRDPPDLNQLKPGLMVLIDTQPPILKISGADKIGDDCTLVWEIQEQYPELNSLRLEYRPAGDPVGQWQPVQISPALSGQARFRPGVAGAVQVRMMIQDAAGNQAQTTQTIGQVALAGGATPPSSAPQLPMPSNVSSLPPPPSGVMIPPIDGPPPPIRDVPPPLRTETPSAPVTRSEPVRETTSGSSPLATSTHAGGSAPAPRQEMRNTQLINSTQISLDYEVPKVGPSGVKSIKLYMTRDDGRSWEELADHKDLQSPIAANLPGEGVFGFRLVVESGAGLSKGTPLPGDAPELRIEVDLSPPYLELYAPAPDPNNRETLILRWNAADKNLASNPISLEYSTNKEGPWVPIAQNVPNSGSYAWKLSQRLPYRVFVRVTARDLAGNIGEVKSPEPQLIDLTKPEGHLIGIKSTSVQIRP
jgi:hypothetical protein